MATKDKSGFYNVNEMLRGIYGWSVKDGKVVTPKYEFPEEFKKRIDYFGEYMGDGLTLKEPCKPSLLQTIIKKLLRNLNGAEHGFHKQKKLKNLLTIVFRLYIV